MSKDSLLFQQISSDVLLCIGQGHLNTANKQDCLCARVDKSSQLQCRQLCCSQMLCACIYCHATLVCHSLVPCSSLFIFHSNISGRIAASSLSPRLSSLREMEWGTVLLLWNIKWINEEFNSCRVINITQQQRREFRLADNGDIRYVSSYFNTHSKVI